MTKQLERLNSRSFREASFKCAIVPIGACESHGDHMPFGTDGMTAHMLGVRAAERLESTVVLPPLYYGMSDHYRHQPMCVSLSSDTNIRVITDILESLRLADIRRVLVLNGHDGNIPCAEIAARSFKVAHPEMTLALFDWWTIVAQLADENLFEVWSGAGHAGEMETSIGLALFPELMHPDRARGMVPKLDPHIKEIWLFSELTRYGATGAPTKGTRAKGEVVVQIVTDYLVEYLRRFESEGIAHSPIDPDPSPVKAERHVDRPAVQEREGAV
jgi:creatinine amidohydrolase